MAELLNQYGDVQFSADEIKTERAKLPEHAGE